MAFCIASNAQRICLKVTGPPILDGPIRLGNFAKRNKTNERKKMETITVNGKTYYSEATQFDGPIKIVILQRGWVMIGRLERNGSDCKLHNASVIRKWGTTKGLGELASKGRLCETILDECGGVVEFDWLTVVATIAVDETKWK